MDFEQTFAKAHFNAYKTGFLCSYNYKKNELKNGNWFQRNIEILFLSKPKDKTILKYYLETKRRN